MLLHDFALLHLHDQTALLDARQATTHIRTAGVTVPADAFFGALLQRCGREMVVAEMRMLLHSFCLVKFGGNFDPNDTIGPKTLSETTVINTATVITNVVADVLQECGTAAESTFDPLSAETAARFGAAFDAYIAAYADYKEELRTKTINRIEMALTNLYNARATYIPVSAIDQVYIGINAEAAQLEIQYERLNPGGLAGFQAGYRQQ